MEKYNIDDCPNIQCKDCLFFKNNCKRCDGTKVQFAFPWFSSDFYGHHFICKDFEPMHPEYVDFQKWTCFEDFWEILPCEENLPGECRVKTGMEKFLLKSGKFMI